VVKPEGKGPLEEPGRRREDNIKLYGREVVRDSVDWIGLAQDRDHWRTFVNIVLNPWVALNVS
jgi:hypothetical protein